ncbi:MAG: endonuclease/exonuclease/phosphatase family protein, partial [Thermoanaerobaculia bacterium]
EPRGALEAVVEVPGAKLAVFNTHIDASRDDFYRLQEMAKLLQLATNSINRLGRSTMVGGDLNAEPGSAVIGMLRGSPLRDAWPDCGQGAELTYPANAPVKRIDYLLLPADWICVSAEVIDTQGSDHRPVLFVIRRVNR